MGKYISWSSNSVGRGWLHCGSPLAAWEASCTFLTSIRGTWPGKFVPRREMLAVSILNRFFYWVILLNYCSLCFNSIIEKIYSKTYKQLNGFGANGLIVRWCDIQNWLAEQLRLESSGYQFLGVCLALMRKETHLIYINKISESFVNKAFCWRFWKSSPDGCCTFTSYQH
jgi:hypothetical protein